MNGNTCYAHKRSHEEFRMKKAYQPSVNNIVM